jgi:hypothetical protein
MFVRRIRIRTFLSVAISSYLLTLFHVQPELKHSQIQDFQLSPAMIFQGVLLSSEEGLRNQSESHISDTQGKQGTIHRHHNPSLTVRSINNDTNTTMPPMYPMTTLGLPKDFPKWMRMYFNWHSKFRRSLNQSNWKNFKYLILRCTHEDRLCGGLADRLKPLPYLIRLAARHKRVFLIRWDRPARLEEFVLPNKLDWTVPDWMVTLIENNSVSRGEKVSAREWSNLTASDEDIMVLEGRIRDIFGGAAYYTNAVDDPSETYEVIYHKVFRALFKASPPIEILVNDIRSRDELIAGQYAVAHYRAFYAIEDKKDKVPIDTHRLLAINAANCASKLRPGGPVYFASDSKVAVDAVKDYATEYNYPISVLESDEALHIDKFSKDDQRSPSEFYSIFVDLLLMAEGQCVSYGKGGFGRFALLLSHNATCANRHFYKNKVQPCSWAQL